MPYIIIFTVRVMVVRVYRLDSHYIEARATRKLMVVSAYPSSARVANDAYYDGHIVLSAIR